MIIERLSQKIFYFKDVIPDPAYYINKFEELNDRTIPESQISKWNPWIASNDHSYVYGARREGDIYNNRFGCDMDLTYSILSNTISHAAHICLDYYCHALNIEKPIKTNHFSFQKYFEGSEMGYHVDSDDETDSKHPVVSGVFYFNDDHVGGEIEFKNQGISIKPEPGSLLIFPAQKPYYHKSSKIEKGNKYMSPFFWYKNI